MEQLKNDKKNKKTVLLSIEEYEAIQKEFAYYKKTIEELEDKLDSVEAEKIRSESKGTLKFQLSDYVSNQKNILLKIVLVKFLIGSVKAVFFVTFF